MSSISDVVVGLIGYVPNIDYSVAAVILECGMVVLGILFFLDILDFILNMISPR